ncbi:MAG: Na+/H+ antiporter NhaC family protein [Firmicutes bacterium]|nr:Na+/H+ antiporter NhaC family protein [Bacillota bacterium]
MGIDIGILSILPLIITLICVLKFKEITSSLLIGIIAGVILFIANTEPVEGIDFATNAFSILLYIMIDKIKDNASIILILCLMGAITVLIIKSGGSRDYGDWAARRIKSKSMAMLATCALGVILFVDDYFNCLAVGTVMRRITDKFKIARAKLAYLIDATAAPICVIAVISTWGASIISQLSEAGLDNPLEIFSASVQYNFYTILTVIMIVIISVFKWDFGLMAYLENEAERAEDYEFDELSPEPVNKAKGKGKIRDLVIPILVLMASSFLGVYYISDANYTSANPLVQQLSLGNPGFGVLFGCFLTLIFTFIYYRLRKILNFSEITNAVGQGIRSMVDPFIILCLAWTLSSVTCDLLGADEYLSAVITSRFAVMQLPLLCFIVASILSFASGTSWGTYGILIPIAVKVCGVLAPEMMIVVISAVLAGAVFGDHCSPISDTTILSSSSAMCDHDDHVKSQIPYALLVAGCSAAGYLLMGYTGNYILSLVVAVVLLVAIIYLLHRNYVRTKEKYANRDYEILKQ